VSSGGGISLFSPYYVPSPDGQRFLVSSTVGHEPGAPLTVVLDWRALVAPASTPGGAGNRP
jgi:hypothetical protein